MDLKLEDSLIAAWTSSLIPFPKQQASGVSPSVSVRVLPVVDVELKLADAFTVTQSWGKRTVIVKLVVPIFPAASVAVHVTGVAPIGNNAPEEWEQVAGT